MTAALPEYREGTGGIGSDEVSVSMNGLLVESLKRSLIAAEIYLANGFREMHLKVVQAGPVE